MLDKITTVRRGRFHRRLGILAERICVASTAP